MLDKEASIATSSLQPNDDLLAKTDTAGTCKVFQHMHMSGRVNTSSPPLEGWRLYCMCSKTGPSAAACTDVDVLNVKAQQEKRCSFADQQCTAMLQCFCASDLALCFSTVTRAV